jgi:splicing factor 3A subunit 2
LRISRRKELNIQLAAEPYETISFAIPSKDMVDDDEDPEATWEHWDADEKVYSCQLLFK